MNAGLKMLAITSRSNTRNGGYNRSEPRGGNMVYGGSEGNDNRRGGGGYRSESEQGDMNYGGYEGNYARRGGNRNEMNYGGAENRFRDRRGREHYENGRFAPMRGEGRNGTEMEMEMGSEMEMRRRGRSNRNEMYGDESNRYEMNRDEIEGYGMGEEGGEARGHYPMTPYRSPMYQPEEEYKPMRKIGFAVGTEYQTTVNYPEMNEMERKSSEMKMGHGSAKGGKMTHELAEEWLESLKNEDGTSGPHWTMEQAKQVMAQKGVQADPIEFWVALNIMYSDYCKVAKKVAANNIDFYVEMAKAFLEDKDAMPNKLGMYYEYIVKK